jgi:methionyl-tRNA synthetase
VADQVAALMDRAEPTQALDLIWQRVKRLNRYVEEKAPWQLARDQSSHGALDEVLRSLFEGIRVLSLLLHPFMPETTHRLLGALGVVDVDYSLTRWRGEVGGTVDALDPLFPKRA